MEIPVASIVCDHNFYWTISRENLAGWQFTSFDPDFYNGSRKRPGGIRPFFDWPQVFSVGGDIYDRALNRLRAAELVAFLSGGPNPNISAPMPFAFVQRIIVPSQHVKQLSVDQENFLTSLNRPILRLDTQNGVVIFDAKANLLTPEQFFVRSLRNRHRADADVINKFNAAINAVTSFEAQHPSLSPSSVLYVDPAMADSHHGTLHAVRVMLWASFLV